MSKSSENQYYPSSNIDRASPKRTISTRTSSLESGRSTRRIPSKKTKEVVEIKPVEYPTSFTGWLLNQSKVIIDRDDFKKMADQIEKRNTIGSTIGNLFQNALNIIVKRTLRPIWQACLTVGLAAGAAIWGALNVVALPFTIIHDIGVWCVDANRKSFTVNALKNIGDAALYLLAAPVIVPTLCVATFAGAAGMTLLSLGKGAVDSVRNAVEYVDSYFDVQDKRPTARVPNKGNPVRAASGAPLARHKSSPLRTASTPVAGIPGRDISESGEVLGPQFGVDSPLVHSQDAYKGPPRQ